MASIALEQLCKSYDGTPVIHNIDLEIRDKEFVVLIGPSGCGKSTTLRMIAGLESISSGLVRINGKVVNDLTPRQRNISMVFQDYALYPHMTVAGNLGFGLRISGMSRDKIKRRVAEAAEILGLTDYLARKPGQLSGGQRQRVAMGRAIVREPDVFLFDEPLSNLDAKLRTQMRLEIKKLHQRVNNTIIHVTHDQVEAMTLADRIVIMRDGIVEQSGTPRDVFENPANTFVATFIGSPPMNLIEVTGAAKNGEAALRLPTGQLIPAPPSASSQIEAGQGLTLGVRADDLSPVGHGLPINGQSTRLVMPVTVTEDMGVSVTVHTMLGDRTLQAVMYNPRPIQFAEELEFEMPLSRLHLFDANTGLRI